MSTQEARQEVGGIVAVSRAMREVIALTDAVARSDCYVLIEGESGTGKELIAGRLHAISERKSGPLIPVNCAGIGETLFESQFFGHVRGAFTGAEQNMLGLVRSADGGTLFMDEVGEIPLSMQPKLLRALQDGEVLPVGTTSASKVDTRFIAATNRNLRQEVRAGNFREDLFYRLNVVRIAVPPLRDRPEDVEALLDHFLACFAERHGRTAEIDAEVRGQLSAYPWPGNVRELVSFVERLYATGLPARVLAEALLAEHAEATVDDEGDEAPLSLAEAEQWAIRRAMQAAQGSVQEAAKLLQVHRSTLSRKLKQAGVA